MLLQKKHIILLWFFLSLFCFRVFAQILQFFFGFTFLPSFNSFQSGALSYPILVVFQFLIIVLLFRACIRATQSKITPKKRTGKILIHLGLLYASIMVLRYVLRMWIYPEERWIGGCIPIFFHLILAAFVFTLGLLHKQNSDQEGKETVGITFTILVSIIYLLIPVFIGYQILPTVIASKLNWRPSQYYVEEDKKVKIDVGDNETLIADVYRPKNLKSAPTILVRIPLDDNFKGNFLSNLLGRLWGSRGYNVVIQGVRGRYGSFGEHIPFQSEREDGIKTIEWLNQQDWHNGKIGMWGGSYFGYTQWVLSDQKELGFAAMFTQISSSDNYNMFYEGGAFGLESALFWASRSYTSEDTPQSYETLSKGYKVSDISRSDDESVQDIPFFNDWVKHTTKDDYWESADGSARSKKLEVPIYMMAGWYDAYLSTQIEDFNNIQTHSSKEIAEACRLVIGPWSHANTEVMPNGYEDENYRYASIRPSLDWFDHHLQNSKKDIDGKVRIFVMGINEWRTEDSFPLKRTNYTRLYLGSDFTLSFDTTPTDSIQYHYDPANPAPSIGGRVLGNRAGPKDQSKLYSRDDVCLFKSEVIRKDLEVTGNIQLELFVSSSSNNTDFTAKLVDIYPDGRCIIISEGILRKNYSSNTKEKITVKLNATSNVFLRGHRVGLEISSSSHPRYARNLNEADQTIYYGELFASNILLPIIEN